MYVYEVMAPGKEPHYRFGDPYRKTLRVHTLTVLEKPGLYRAEQEEEMLS